MMSARIECNVTVTPVIPRGSRARRCGAISDDNSIHLFLEGPLAGPALTAPPHWPSVFDKTDGTNDSENPAMNDHMMRRARLDIWDTWPSLTDFTSSPSFSKTGDTTFVKTGDTTLVTNSD